MTNRKSRPPTDTPATCRNCGHAFMATPCPSRDFILRPSRCPMTRGWVPISAMFEPVSEERRQWTIDQALRGEET